MLGEQIQPIDQEKRKIKRKIGKSLRKDAPVMEKQIIDDTSLKTKYPENRITGNNLLKIGVIAYIIIECC